MISQNIRHCRPGNLILLIMNLLLHRNVPRFIACNRYNQCLFNFFSSLSHDDDIKRFENEIIRDKLWLKDQNNTNILNNEYKKECHISTNSFNEYISKRGFSNENNLSALNVLSSILTYPLSISYCINKIFHLYKNSTKKNLNILIIGARSESSLPNIWWKETLYNSDIFNNIKLEFVGPHIMINNKENKTESLSFNNNNIIINPLTFDNKLLLHNNKNIRNLLLDNDLYILFNPGFGSKSLKNEWEDTLKYLLWTKKPIVCTALNLSDLNRDLDYIKNIANNIDSAEQDLGESLEFIIKPHINPFQSLKTYIDYKETKEFQIMNNNHYIYAFSSK